MSSSTSLTAHNNFSAQSFDHVAQNDLTTSGYSAPVFLNKSGQMDLVLDKLDASGLIPEGLIEHETVWFYKELGIDDTFFATESPDAIAKHILALYSAKVDAYARESVVALSHKRIAQDGSHAVYFSVGDTTTAFEQEIDDRFLDKGTAFRLQSFSSDLAEGTKLNCAFVYKCVFEGNTDKVFAASASAHTKTLYKEVLAELAATDGPVVKHFAVTATGEQRIIVGYKQGSSPRYVSALSALAGYYGASVKRKYVESFADGYCVCSLYIEHSEEYTAQALISQVSREASLLYCVPNNLFQQQFLAKEMSLQECIYAHCGVIFVTHFLNRLGPEFSQVKNALRLDDPKNLELVSRLKERLTAETFSQEFIQECLARNVGLVRRLYRQFADAHYVSSGGLEKTLSYLRVEQIEPLKSEEEFLKAISLSDEASAKVLTALYTFNKSILKTNFFVTSKLALSFKLNADFLPKEEYPEPPFGMFFVVGSDFRGFHIRFRDIARGGIRIVKSRSLDAYVKNRRTMIDENYGLASTQQRKNKDIPEGGSKGVILLDPGHAQNKVTESFEKYIDALLDLLIKDPAKEAIIDLYGQPEMLFMGPDENTATLVDWATLHAKKRGAEFGFAWKAFFTGKSPELGGIPHDQYGMTTLSVRAYVEGAYGKLGITDWSKVNKLQMAGGDGDLGSNEIKLSGDENYVALVDGFGVIVDEDGINKKELLRLAEKRLGNDHFDTSKLGPKGYVVMVDDKDITTPGGKVIASGLAFRNNFHLELPTVFSSKGFVQLFVPCGGRPASINANNVHALIDEKTGKSNIPIIVEGANLFITQAAKIILERSGAVVFKDASTNKGGVTSSSKEVLAALSFSDSEFKHNMCLDPETKEVPAFYKQYVKEVQSTVVANAKAEFALLWKLKQERGAGATFSELSDELSVAINRLADQLRSSKEMWENDVSFRDQVLASAVPSNLLAAVGIENILKRVPEAYLKALFATKLASEFVYTRGVDANPAKFLEFVSSLKK